MWDAGNALALPKSIAFGHALEPFVFLG